MNFIASLQTRSRHPPIRYFPDDCPVAEIDAFAFSIIRLVDDQVEIAARSVDIVYQEVGDSRLPIATPLREQLCKKLRRKGITYSSRKYAGIERLRRKRDTIKLDQRLYTQLRVRFDDCVHADTASRAVIELPELDAQLTEHLTTAAAVN